MRRRLVHREHVWVSLRMIGWGLAALIPISDILASLGLIEPPGRIALALLSLTGIILVAIGFERIVELSHERTGAH